MDAELRQRVEELESRLDDYHRRLTNAVAQRDRLAIDAAWGVHHALYNILAVIALLYGYDRYMGDAGWLAEIAAAIVIVVAMGAVHFWSNGARMKEVDRFSTLPEWEWRGH